MGSFHLTCLSACLWISVLCPALAQASHALALRPYAYLAEAKRAPHYNFGLGKRPAASSKLYSFGLGKRAVQYDEDGFSSDERNAISDEQEDEEDVWDSAKRSRSYSFGVGKRAKPYGFGLGKRARTYGFGLGKRGQLYSFGLGKKRDAERRFAFGLGKRSDGDAMDEEDTWSGSSESYVGKREVREKDLSEVAAAPGNNHSIQKRAAPMQYSFGLGKRPDWAPAPQTIAFLEDDDEVDDGEDDLVDGELLRSGRASMHYGFGIGKRGLRMELQPQGKRGPRNYGFGLGRRSMQYNFGIGKRSSDSSEAPSAGTAATAIPATSQ